MNCDFEIWHRFENWMTAPPVDEFDNPCGTGQMHVRHVQFKVIKRTAKGVWLSAGYGDRRFVLTEARKKYAAPTASEAFFSFKARKEKEAIIYEARAKRALEALRIGTSLYEKLAVIPEGEQT